MASTNQGDDAVARLDAAVTAFEEILTGPEGQTVAVPGKNPQPTLAERVKQNLKPSTDAAAGYAAQAREEATKAAREADRASQIAGLDTVAEAVGLAAIPFPDVWIPLSDSLRMLAGYGREVKVGDDVVATYATLTRNSAATMVNKSLSLTPAAINEARFEREGLLAEVLSTNILTGAIRFPASTIGGATANSTSPLAPNLKTKVIKGVGTGSILFSQSRQIVPVDTVMSATFILDLAQTKLPDGKKHLGFQFSYSSWWVGGGAGVYVNIETGEITSSTSRLSFSETEKLGDLLIVKAGMRTVTEAPDTAGPSMDVYSINDQGAGFENWNSEFEIHLIGCQLEALPFSTSHIPTDGAAVTRAADKLTIPRLNNDCAEWYSGPDQINPIVTADTIELCPPAGKAHLRNVRGFFTPLTPAQKAALK